MDLIKRCFVISCIICFGANLSNAQRKMGNEYQLGFMPYVGASYQYHWNGDVGVLFGKSEIIDGTNPPFYPYAGLGSEFYFADKKLYLGPKVSLELLWRPLCFRVSMIDYTNFTNQDYRLTPEVGIKLYLVRSIFRLNVISIYYGYNIPIGAERIGDVPGNRITIILNPKPRVYRV